MSILAVIGFILSALVVGVSLYISTDNALIFLDFPSFFIVVGGTFASVAICFRIERIFTLCKIFLIRVLTGKEYNYTLIITELMQLVESYRKGTPLTPEITKSKDPFLTDAIKIASENILSEDDLVRVLTERADNMQADHITEANKMKVIAKFPPAYGMMGTTIGMIVLLGNLAAADAIKKVGPAMGLALITTLYGMLISNALVIPMAENLISNARDVYLKNQIIIHALRLMMRKTNPVIVAIELNSFLPPGKRVDWKEVIGRK